MSDNEKAEQPDQELTVFSKIEGSVNDHKPLKFEKSDSIDLRGLYQKEGLNMDLNKKELASLIYGTQLRARVILDENDNAVGVEIYKRNEEEGKRWVPFDVKKGITESEEEDYFWDTKSGKYDRLLGLIKILGSERFAQLAIDCYREAKNRGYKGVIGKEKSTKGRGLMQMAANTLLLGITDPQEDEIMDHVIDIVNNKVNGTLLKSFVGVAFDPEMMDKTVVAEFEKAGFSKTPEEFKKTAGVNPGSYLELVGYLSGKPNVFGAPQEAET